MNILRTLGAPLVLPLAERWTGRSIRPKVRAIAAEMQLSGEARLVRRRQQLAAILARAQAEVPYYRELFALLHFDPQRVARDVAYLGDLPVLTKDILREQGDRMLSQKYLKGSLHVRKTGGSTGASVPIYYSPQALDWTAAVNRYAVGTTGRRAADLEVHLASRYPQQFPLRDRLKEHAKCLALNRANIFTDRFDGDALALIWQKLRRQRPYLVQAHPSTLYALAVWLAGEQRDARDTFRVFESTGEVLDERKRRTIEQVFGCRTVNRYGNAEFGVVAYEQPACEKPGDLPGRLRVFDCLAWPETIERSGGTELLATGLCNDAMPLVRYATGDLAQLESAENGFFLSALVGRTHDVVSIGTRTYPTHYLQDVLDRLGGIDEFQVEQLDRGRLRLSLVVGDASRRAIIAERVQAWWPGDIELEFKDFAGLKREGWRSKFRYLVAKGAA